MAPVVGSRPVAGARVARRPGDALNHVGLTVDERLRTANRDIAIRN